MAPAAARLRWRRARAQWRLVDDRSVRKGELLACTPLVGDIVDDDGLAHALNRPPLKTMIGGRGGNKDEGAVAGKRRATDRCLVGIVDVRAQALVLGIR